MQNRIRSASKRQIGDWRREWIEQGLDRKYSFESYRKMKSNERFRRIRQEKALQLSNK